jgi:hypothetical protein
LGVFVIFAALRAAKITKTPKLPAWLSNYLIEGGSLLEKLRFSNKLPSKDPRLS